MLMAGVPSIIQAMLDEVAPKLRSTVRMLSETVRADAREGDIGTQLGEIAKANPAVAIGRYPFFDPRHGPNTNVVLRVRDAQKLAQAKRAVEDMLERVRRAQSQQGFESPRERHLVLICEHPVWQFWLARTAFSIKSVLPLIRT
jgi:molybdopterin-biosynthesis enzyme MoeA-like protein